MSKKTAPKKKPTQLDRIEALAKSAHAEAGLAHAATIALQQRIDAMRHEQVALSQESRSAPAEEWVPVIGEYYTATADLGWYKNGCVYRYGHHAGRITEHLAMCDKPHSSIIFSPEHHGHILRPATVQEIADHKAKEEQRAKELAKVPEFGTRVKTPKGEGIYLGREGGTYTIATPYGSQFNFDDYTRDSFTIID